MKKYFPSKNRHKYRAKPTVIDGIRFASKREGRRYQELKLLERANRISGFQRQVRFELVIRAVYVADFVYFDESTGEEVVEDVKGYRTQEYKRKKRLMREQHAIEIREV